jgi:cold shock CspA family protein
MQGKVKWFSQQKGYGFITDDAGVDHHFRVSDVRGATLPQMGALVRFEAQAGQRGPKARDVNLLGEGEPSAVASIKPQRHDDHQVTCLGCNRRMVPRVIIGPPLVGRDPVPHRSICPFCGLTFQVFPPSAAELKDAAFMNNYRIAVLITTIVLSGVFLWWAFWH